MKNEKYSVKNTAGMFDLIKGIAMFIVILVHTYAFFPVYQNIEVVDGSRLVIGENFNILAQLLRVIYSVVGHALMPALFVISGYGFRNTTFKKNVVKQFKALMIPYIVTMFITTLLHLITHFSLYHYLKGSLIETLRIFAGSFFGIPKTSYYFGIKIFSNGPNWFLLSLFIGLIVFNSLLNRFEKKKLLIAVLTVSLTGWLLSLLSFTVPWCISQGLVCVFFIYLGYTAKKKKLFTEGIDTKKKIIYAITVVIPTIVIRTLGFMDGMADSVYPFGMLTVIWNGLFCLIIIYLFLLLNRTHGAISSSIRTVGRYSIYILCIHTIEMMGFPLYHFVEMWNGNIVLGSVILIVGRIATVFFICFLYLKIKNLVLMKIAERKEKTAIL